ncbi:DnaJ domain-containing protein [Mycoemilia scoparia]|uniref:DnaJ domain-containing protein n=1 Tax=Mycoemilia scoparia TaxID=417184 RepID=A0A9W7ZTT2_9FUNG|nr:DnaJ domain-containing protein [Mycoemilia scoparia]
MSDTKDASPTTTNNTAPKANTNEEIDDKEIEKLLKQQESQLPRDQEIDRILSTFKLDPFSILQVPVICTPTEIRNAYRKKSLLIHPDKAQHPKAPEAFEILKKASTMLNDQKEKERLTKMMWDAEKDLIAKWRSEIKKGTRSASDLEGDNFDTTDKFRNAVREHYKDFTVEIEWRKRQKLRKAMREQGEEDKKKEDAALEAKRKREHEKAWEESREDRVNSWRDFMSKSKKKKKSKKNSS